jgi:mediator of replication checkpoint protein 1
LPTSPGGSESHHDSGSESDLGLNTGNAKLKALVAQKRAARHTAERAAKEKRRATAKALARSSPTIIADESGDEGEDEEDADRSLTQQAKPTRKASKKALEEINRETQRIARNQQLAHKLHVKKKFTKKDLLKSFGYPTAVDEEKSEDDVRKMSGALQSSDVEADRHPETPPSSPPSEVAPEPKADLASLEPADSMNIDADLQSPSDPKINIPKAPKSAGKKPLAAAQVNIAAVLDDSDDDLEIVHAKPKATAFLDRLPSKKARLSNPMLALKHLANLTSPSKTRHGKANLTFKQLQVKLLQDARNQARKDKEERINELRARGIHIQTAEEREKEQLEVENALERARQDADDLAKKEKSDAKREGEDDSDDEEWAEPMETDPELSGSDADDADDEDGESEAENPFFDQEAEDEDSESDLEVDGFLHKTPSSSPKETKTAPRKRRVILDDEEDDEPRPSSASQKADAIAAAGLRKSAFGLSQIFAGTLADEDDEDEGAEDQINFSPGHLFMGEPTTPLVSLDFGSRIVPTSQSARSNKALPSLDLSLSQLPSQPIESPSKMSEVEFTQDVGFAVPRAPMGKRDLPQSTSDTVLLASPEKKGRLRRRASLVAVLSDADEDDAPDAFDTLFKGARRRAAADEFDKKKSAARNLVEEQAEESEDEYKGIGGASDDESAAGEYDEEVAQMIEEGHVEVDEMEIAALHA